MILPLAVTRSDVAGYVDALFYVYSLLIILYVLSQLFFGMGGRVPYSRWTDGVLGFLRDVCEPYLRIFRSFMPMVGMFDISPIVALLVLQLARTIIVSAIQG